MREILRAIAATYYWEGYQIDPIMPAKLTAEELSVYAGRYRLDADTIYIVEPTAGRPAGPRPARGDLHARAGVAGRLRPSRQRDALHLRSAGRRRRPARRSTRIRKRSTAPRVNKTTRVPGEDLEEGRVDDAVAAYKKLVAANPSDPSLSEARFNSLGYEWLQKKDYPKAIAVFRLNTELYPASTNPWDSLGEGLEASGDKAGAIAAYKKCVEVASAAGAGESPTGKTHALERLKALGATP